VLLCEHLVASPVSGNNDSGFGQRPNGSIEVFGRASSLDLIPELFILGYIATGEATEVALPIVKAEMELPRARWRRRSTGDRGHEREAAE
jgi:hypothetical protein